jgi:nicotinic acid mononucleotide adenylyltransferase
MVLCRLQINDVDWNDVKGSFSSLLVGKDAFEGLVFWKRWALLDGKFTLVIYLIHISA